MDYSLNRIVAIPNWSFYDPGLCESARAILTKAGVRVHYCKGDIDHQRSVIAFSGDQRAVFGAMDALSDLLLPKIDLRIQLGVHPRIGALDVAPFVILEGYEFALIEATIEWSMSFSRRFRIPVRLYEKAAKPGNEHRLPYLRGQMGELRQNPDFGDRSNMRIGTSVIGVRDFLLATNINLASEDLATVKSVAKEIREGREAGIEDLKGVRALGFPLRSRHLTQLSLNLTDPNFTSFDTVLAIAKRMLDERDINIVETELIGVIRERDVAGAQHLTFDPSQVVY